ncbi:MAG: serine/threonine protein kinase [Muribaculaceae bacterium]|nr:serine/threonine protein kinase [Muribaculaceae bacterium]
MADLKIGTKVKDRYTLKEFKGSGSFGEVWLAHDEVLDTDVAIKIYISLDPRGVEEFKSEYITTQGISHPNLLTTNYFDVWEQRPYLVMKYCAKGASTTQAGKMDEYDLWQFIHDVASGLKHLHNMPEPIIHQDIKPDNILVDDNNRFLITDFGISKKIRSTMRKQSKRAVGAGATAYMGPERFDADPSPVKASDMWSLGVSIYELATGELPFSGLGGGMQKNGAEIPSLDNKWSKDLNMVMQSCLAKETWDRPTAQQLEEYSDAILNGQPATVTWNIKSAKSDEETPDYVVKPDESGYVDGNDEGIHSNTKRIWFAIASILAAVVILILIWPSVNNDEEIIIPEDTVEAIDSMVAEGVETVPPDIPEVQSTKKEITSVPSPVKKDESKIVVKEETKTENNATLLKTAIANGDYQQVQRLANQGYAAAYGPLAKYYLNNHDYQTAESYAKKAKAAGFREGSDVIKTLENLGYYD